MFVVLVSFSSTNGLRRGDSVVVHNACSSAPHVVYDRLVKRRDSPRCRGAVCNSLFSLPRADASPTAAPVRPSSVVWRAGARCPWPIPLPPISLLSPPREMRADVTNELGVLGRDNNPDCTSDDCRRFFDRNGIRAQRSIRDTAPGSRLLHRSRIRRCRCWCPGFYCRAPKGPGRRCNAWNRGG